ncbi:MAG: hypothetical protein IH856_23845 [Deltaproteobacteria bacterium]|nr:hypothetical protein [Deltaproteobacteria bacterium]
MFESARLKIKRADHHISDLEAEFAEFVATKPHRFVVHNDPHTEQIQIRVRFAKHLPETLSLIIGDAAHNLRSALDHLIWEAVGLDGGTQDKHLKFPSGDNRVNFESSCKGIVGASKWIIERLIELEIFPDGNGYMLYALNVLDNRDKHTTLNISLRATSHPDFAVFREDGTLLRKMSGNVFITTGKEGVRVGNIPPGCYLELDDNAECAPDIFLPYGNRGPFPALKTLKQVSQMILEIIKTFEAAILARDNPVG